jgi:hypothetical protein
VSDDPDFSLADFGTVSLLTPITGAACDWAAGNLPENVLRWGGGIAIHSSRIASVLESIAGHGLLIETG